MHKLLWVITQSVGRANSSAVTHLFLVRHMLALSLPLTLFYIAAGHLFHVSAAVLVIFGIITLFIRLSPTWLTRAVAVLAFLLIAASVVVFSAYATEAFFVVRSANPYERFTFELQLRSWFYWFEVVAAILPQLFWFPRFRRPGLPIIGIFIGSISPYLFEYAAIEITQYFRPS